MSKAEKRVRLDDDGELREVDEMGDAAEPIYCTRCGTANPASGKFCRKCGHDLELQEAEMVGIAGRTGLPKLKHDLAQSMQAEAQPRRRRNPGEDMPVQVVTLIAVCVMALTALFDSGGESSAAIIPILLGWLGVEGLRIIRPHGVGGANLPINIVTTILVMVMTVASIVGGAAPASIIIMLLWIAIEGFRTIGDR